MADPIQWIFDELPPSGARRGGEIAEHAFGHQIDHFVREVCQNANDQAIDAARIDFDLHVLEGEPLQRFLQALSWDRLREHLAGAGETDTPAGRRLAAFLAEFEAQGRLLALRIEDRGTVGLTGDEDGERSHFRALCKDTLFSVKRRDGAGGSYGLGKSVLWSFSGLATVLFSSQLSEHPEGARSPRVIGRAELPYHQVDGDGFAGPGWFGRRVALDHGRERAESVWSKQAKQLSRRLEIERREDPETAASGPPASGTTIMVLGFRDPTDEGHGDPKQIKQALRQHAATWFWPAMQADGRGLEIHVDRAPVVPEAQPELAPFIDCWRRRAEAKPTLERPGDIARVPIPVELPRPRDGTRKLAGHVDLLIRLGDEHEQGERCRSLATVRGAGMVVEYRNLSGVAGLRPFHAILVCGLARQRAAPSDVDAMIEQFLRDAEPPGHDTWHVTPAIKDGWVRGSGQVFVRLWDSVLAVLRQMLAPVVEVGVEGPERLRKRFPLGRRGRAGEKGPSAFHFREFDASLSAEAWRFAGTIEPELGGRPWRVQIGLHHLGEDGARVRELAIASFETEPKLPIERVAGGVAVEVPLGITRLAISGTSEDVAAELLHTELGLRVFGELREPA